MCRFLTAARNVSKVARSGEGEAEGVECITTTQA